jgi:DNA-directed RNA polymerase
MTTPYGAGRFGFTKQLDAEIRKKEEESGGCFLGEDAPKKAVIFMAQVNKQAIGQVVKKAIEGMDFLKDCAKISALAVKDGIVWTTPLGFRACQIYKKTKTERIESFFGGLRLRTNVQQDLPRSADKIRHVNGLAPNFIHSYDATHLFMTVNELIDEGIQHFAMIHDSFGTHAGRTGELFRAVRHSFVDLYKERNIFQDFKDELADQLAPEVWADLPDVPERGDLDLDDVLDAPYFFA